MPISPSPPSGTKTSSSVFSFMCTKPFLDSRCGASRLLRQFVDAAARAGKKTSPASTAWHPSAVSSSSRPVASRSRKMPSRGPRGVATDNAFAKPRRHRQPSPAHRGESRAAIPLLQVYVETASEVRKDRVGICVRGADDLEVGRGIGETVGVRAAIDPDADHAAIASARQHRAFEKHPGQLGTVVENVVGPFQLEQAIAVEQATKRLHQRHTGDEAELRRHGRCRRVT